MVFGILPTSMPHAETHRPTLLCDIDRTMVITPKITDSALVSLAPEVSLQQAFLYRDEYLATLGPDGSRYFHPTRFIEFIVCRLGCDINTIKGKNLRQTLLRKYLHREHFNEAVYPDVVPVLSDLASCCVLGTFSEGVYHWQYYKLYCTQLLGFFRDKNFRFILPNKRIRQVIATLPIHAIIPDDNIHVIAALAAAQAGGQQIFPIWVNRDGSVTPAHLAMVPSITSFTELPPLIEKLLVSSLHPDTT